MTLLLIYALSGSLAGLLAGLLGGGSGLIMIPTMVMLLEQQGVDQNISMHLAIGTNMLASAVLCGSAAISQQQKKAIDWHTLKRMLLGLLLGLLAGAICADELSGTTLRYIFSGVILSLAIWMLFHREKKVAPLPPHFVLHNIAGFIVAALTSLSGTSIFTVPYFRKCGLAIRQAIGTATACALLFSFAGGAIFMFLGYHHPLLPPHSIGYVYLPMLLPFSLASALGGYAGARLAHAISPVVLKYTYIALMFIVAIKMAL